MGIYINGLDLHGGSTWREHARHGAHSADSRARDGAALRAEIDSGEAPGPHSDNLVGGGDRRFGRISASLRLE